ncbi:acyl carrier protein [Actinomadura terrae]|uniref:acyl carrier protein n=1 Tax=Actinomadura terrae TaxID=604353 RepID=UPI001FA7126B|nr:acyl carrier protein [Actinomadura terrae]
MSTENTRRSEVHRTVCTIVATTLSVPAEQVTESTRLKDLGADSLDFAEMASALSEHGMGVDKADLKEVSTVGDVTDLAAKNAEGAT